MGKGSSNLLAFDRITFPKGYFDHGVEKDFKYLSLERWRSGNYYRMAGWRGWCLELGYVGDSAKSQRDET